MQMSGRMFWNPSWNESLFLVSCAERLLQNPTPHSEDEIMIGLNRFFWIWIAAYPSILWFQQRFFAAL